MTSWTVLSIYHFHPKTNLENEFRNTQNVIFKNWSCEISWVPCALFCVLSKQWRVLDFPNSTTPSEDRDPIPWNFLSQYLTPSSGDFLWEVPPGSVCGGVAQRSLAEGYCHPPGSTPSNHLLPEQEVCHLVVPNAQWVYSKSPKSTGIHSLFHQKGISFRKGDG